MCWSPQEYITHESVPASPAVSCMSGSSNLNSFRDRRQVAVQLVSCGVLPPGLFQNCSQLHSSERAAAGIGRYVNAYKTDNMCYNQTGDISTLDGTPLKQVDKFTYLGSSVASTEKEIDTRSTKAWTAMNRLSIIWKSDLTDKMKRSFFQAAVTSILLYRCTTWTLKKNGRRRSYTAITMP